jgi:hypothetical protein
MFRCSVRSPVRKINTLQQNQHEIDPQGLEGLRFEWDYALERFPIQPGECREERLTINSIPGIPLAVVEIKPIKASANTDGVDSIPGRFPAGDDEFIFDNNTFPKAFCDRRKGNKRAVGKCVMCRNRLMQVKASLSQL